MVASLALFYLRPWSQGVFAAMEDIVNSMMAEEGNNTFRSSTGLLRVLGVSHTLCLLSLRSVSPAFMLL